MASVGYIAPIAVAGAVVVSVAAVVVGDASAIPSGSRTANCLSHYMDLEFMSRQNQDMFVAPSLE